MTHRSRRCLAALAATLTASTFVPAAVARDASSIGGSSLATSLPSVRTGERPGPAVLYSAAPRAPQLEHAPGSPFVAPFDRVSGTERYVDGEYLSTDHLYDDRGADNAVVYPTDRARYGDNAADLVEVRLSTLPEDGSLAFRFTLNTLLEPDSTIVVAAFDTDRSASTGAATLPADPGSPFPGTDAVLTTWGTGATWSTWDPTVRRWSVASAPAVTPTVDLERNQLTVVVPEAVARAGRGVWRTTVGVGLHDGNGGFLRPRAEPTATEPGGSEGASGLFNVAFRFAEPVVTEGGDPDTAQGEALAANAPTTFARDIDLGALRDGLDRTTVPTTGPMVRFFPSRLALGEGKDLEAFPAFLGQLQPYSLYVPSGYTPGVPTPLTLDLHSLGERHWQYTGSEGVQQLGEARGNLVATADARGEDGWYQREAEYDVFEMWNDIAAHFSLDADRTTVTGYSMGGYGTYRFGTLYPDLFARAGSVVGPPGDGIWFGAGAPTGGAETLTNLWLENARNLPFLNIVAGADELVPIAGTTQQNVGPAARGRTSFDALGYRFAFDVYPAAEHLTLGILGYDLPQLQAWLGDERVDRDPFHVTFAYTPAADARDLGLVHDKAYWVDGVTLRDPAAGPAVTSTAPAVGKAVVDAESFAFGIDDPPSVRTTGSGTVPLPYVETGRTWSAPIPRPAANAVALTLTNVASATIDLARARLDSRRSPITLQVLTDGPSSVVLRDRFGHRATVAVSPDATTYTIAPAAFR